MLTSGQLLAERYKLSRRIAVGGMGEVWEAADTRLDRRVAVKVLKPELCGDAEFLHRFRTEARTTASLNHPGIAAVHDYGETAAVPDGPEDTAYLVMELVEGEPLAAILANQGRISAEMTLEILEQAGHALQAAHDRRYVHRDVKPGNILIVNAGQRIAVKLTDFGIAKAADAAPVTRRGMVMGTAHYIAPEQALGNEAEPASDVYSLAVVGYECLMGHRPFLSENAVTVAMMHIRDIPPALPPDVPPGARAIIEATLVKDPRQRYANGGEFAAAVAAVRAGLPLPAPSGLAMVSAQGVGTQGNTHPRMAPAGPGTIPPFTPVSGSFPMPPPTRSRRRTWLTLLVVVLIAALVASIVVFAVVILPRLTGGTGNTTPGIPAPRVTAVPGGNQVPGGTSISPTDGPVSSGAGLVPPQRMLPSPTVVQALSGEYRALSTSRTAGQPRGLGPEAWVRTRPGTESPAGLLTCHVKDVTPTGQQPIGSPVTIGCEPRD